MQSDLAMKVSTDSILLAKYSKNFSYSNVLEIGCGIGLITFLLHNNNSEARFQGIDIQDEAILLANQSLELNRINSHVSFSVTDVQDFFSENKFDLIVSNPPYFVNQLNASNIVRNEFRHSERKFITSFADKCLQFCDQEIGKVIIIIPSQMEPVWSQEFSQKGFILNELVELRYRENYEISLVICHYALTLNKFSRTEWLYGYEKW